jgi:XapX domain-containing protein
MKALLISFVVGLLVGVAYGVIRVKSPAPPIIALLGLLGMVLGEQAGGWEDGYLQRRSKRKT